MKKAKILKSSVMVMMILMMSLTVANANYVARGWSKKGNCISGGGNCGVCIVDSEYEGAENEIPITLTLDGSTLIIHYQRQLTQLDDDYLELDAPLSLPQSICTDLGVQSVTLETGIYNLDYSTNPYGDLIVDVSVVN